jgi:hypothetical protein
MRSAVFRISKTHWIGDKAAYERFRKYEHHRGHQHEHGRAVNAALFADEMTGSPASDLYSIMRNVVQRDVPCDVREGRGCAAHTASDAQLWNRNEPILRGQHDAQNPGRAIISI